MGVEAGIGVELDRVWRKRAKASPTPDTLHRLRELVARGQAAWPELTPDLTALETFIAERTEGPDDLDPERGADWVLASECARGEARAIAAFEARLMPQIVGAVRRLKLSPGELDLALQRVRTDILVSAPERPAGITRYAGRGELSAWLRVSAVRAAMKLGRGRGRESSFEDEQLGERISGASEDPELEYMKALYRPHFKDAFREALLELEPKERSLLKQSLLDGLSIDALAGLHQVHRATVARWITAAREKLIGATRARFQAKVRVNARECDSIFRALGSQLDITLRRLSDAD
jgi:RNA polymerase sigma-70 factor (ECF subfamily)